MYQFETMVEFIGEERPITIEWEWCDDQIWIRSVKIALVIDHNWTRQGKPEPWQERHEIEIILALSDEQIHWFSNQIKADQAKKAAEDFHDSKLLDWEERFWYRKAA